MSRLPIPHIINTIKTKLGFDRTMTASGEDVVDAVNKQSQQIDNLQAAAAYVEDGDTATQKTYAEGEFVVWKGSLYTVNSGGIPLGEAISGHVTAVTGGGLNALTDIIQSAFLIQTFVGSFTSLGAGASLMLSKSDFNYSAPQGYTAVGIIGFECGNQNITTDYCRFSPETSNLFRITNRSSSTQSDTVRLIMLFAKTILI